MPTENKFSNIKNKISIVSVPLTVTSNANNSSDNNRKCQFTTSSTNSLLEKKVSFGKNIKISKLNSKKLINHSKLTDNRICHNNLNIKTNLIKASKLKNPDRDQKTYKSIMIIDVFNKVPNEESNKMVDLKNEALNEPEINYNNNNLNVLKKSFKNFYILPSNNLNESNVLSDNNSATNSDETEKITAKNEEICRFKRSSVIKSKIDLFNKNLIENNKNKNLKRPTKMKVNETKVINQYVCDEKQIFSYNISSTHQAFSKKKNNYLTNIKGVNKNASKITNSFGYAKNGEIARKVTKKRQQQQKQTNFLKRKSLYPENELLDSANNSTVSINDYNQFANGNISITNSLFSASLSSASDILINNGNYENLDTSSCFSFIKQKDEEALIENEQNGDKMKDINTIHTSTTTSENNPNPSDLSDSENNLISDNFNNQILSESKPNVSNNKKVTFEEVNDDQLSCVEYARADDFYDYDEEDEVDEDDDEEENQNLKSSDDEEEFTYSYGCCINSNHDNKNDLNSSLNNENYVQTSEFDKINENSVSLQYDTTKDDFDTLLLNVHRLPGEKLGMNLKVEEDIEGSKVFVENVLINGAAYRASDSNGCSCPIKNLDEIIEINGVKLKNMKNDDVLLIVDELPLFITLKLKRHKDVPSINNSCNQIDKINEKEQFSSLILPPKIQGNFKDSEVLSPPPGFYYKKVYLSNLDSKRIMPCDLIEFSNDKTYKGLYRVLKTFSDGVGNQEYLKRNDILLMINERALTCKNKFELIARISNVFVTGNIHQLTVLREIKPKIEESIEQANLNQKDKNKQIPYHNGIFAQNSIKLAMRKYETPLLKSNSDSEFNSNNNISLNESNQPTNSIDTNVVLTADMSNIQENLANEFKAKLNSLHSPSKMIAEQSNDNENELDDTGNVVNESTHLKNDEQIFDKTDESVKVKNSQCCLNGQVVDVLKSTHNDNWLFYDNKRFLIDQNLQENNENLQINMDEKLPDAFHEYLDSSSNNVKNFPAKQELNSLSYQQEEFDKQMMMSKPFEVTIISSNNSSAISQSMDEQNQKSVTEAQKITSSCPYLPIDSQTRTLTSSSYHSERSIVHLNCAVCCATTLPIEQPSSKTDNKTNISSTISFNNCPLPDNLDTDFNQNNNKSFFTITSQNDENLNNKTFDSNSSTSSYSNEKNKNLFAEANVSQTRLNEDFNLANKSHINNQIIENVDQQMISKNENGHNELLSQKVNTLSKCQCTPSTSSSLPSSHLSNDSNFKLKNTDQNIDNTNETTNNNNDNSNKYISTCQIEIKMPNKTSSSPLPINNISQILRSTKLINNYDNSLFTNPISNKTINPATYSVCSSSSSSSLSSDEYKHLCNKEINDLNEFLDVNNNDKIVESLVDNTSTNNIKFKNNNDANLLLLSSVSLTNEFVENNLTLTNNLIEETKKDISEYDDDCDNDDCCNHEINDFNFDKSNKLQLTGNNELELNEIKEQVSDLVSEIIDKVELNLVKNSQELNKNQYNNKLIETNRSSNLESNSKLSHKKQIVDQQQFVDLKHYMHQELVNLLKEKVKKFNGTKELTDESKSIESKINKKQKQSITSTSLTETSFAIRPQESNTYLSKTFKDSYLASFRKLNQSEEDFYHKINPHITKSSNKSSTTMVTMISSATSSTNLTKHLNPCVDDSSSFVSTSKCFKSFSFPPPSPSHQQINQQCSTFFSSSISNSINFTSSLNSTASSSSNVSSLFNKTSLLTNPSSQITQPPPPPAPPLPPLPPPIHDFLKSNASILSSSSNSSHGAIAKNKKKSTNKKSKETDLKSINQEEQIERIKQREQLAAALAQLNQTTKELQFNPNSINNKNLSDNSNSSKLPKKLIISNLNFNKESKFKTTSSVSASTLCLANNFCSSFINNKSNNNKYSSLNSRLKFNQRPLMTNNTNSVINKQIIKNARNNQNSGVSSLKHSVSFNLKFGDQNNCNNFKEPLAGSLAESMIDYVDSAFEKQIKQKNIDSAVETINCSTNLISSSSKLSNDSVNLKPLVINVEKKAIDHSKTDFKIEQEELFTISNSVKDKIRLFTNKPIIKLENLPYNIKSNENTIKNSSFEQKISPQLLNDSHVHSYHHHLIPTNSEKSQSLKNLNNLNLKKNNNNKFNGELNVKHYPAPPIIENSSFYKHKSLANLTSLILVGEPKTCNSEKNKIKSMNSSAANTMYNFGVQNLNDHKKFRSTSTLAANSLSYYSTKIQVTNPPNDSTINLSNSGNKSSILTNNETSSKHQVNLNQDNQADENQNFKSIKDKIAYFSSKSNSNKCTNEFGSLASPTLNSSDNFNILKNDENLRDVSKYKSNDRFFLNNQQNYKVIKNVKFSQNQMLKNQKLTSSNSSIESGNNSHKNSTIRSWKQRQHLNLK